MSQHGVAAGTTTDLRGVLGQAAEKVQLHRDRAVFPQYTSGSEWRVTDPQVARPGFMPEDATWTAGFWPGMLWIASVRLRDQRLAGQAQRLARILKSRTGDDRTHDLGFVFMPSCVLGSAVADDPHLNQLAIDAAHTLVLRFDRRGGYLRAWGAADSAEHDGLTTIDALMNAAFVLWMARSTDDEEAEQLAIRHADNALQNQMRPDGSTAQVAAYDPGSGRFLRQGTHQGLSESSCWSRGQAWAIYGFALFAALSGERGYAEASATAADFFWRHLPPDGLPPWDFDDPASDVVDSSALAIAAAGLLCLADATGSGDHHAKATLMLDRLVRRALVVDAADARLLSHGTFSRQLGLGVDESLIFGDFYFMDALARHADAAHSDYMRPRR